MGRPVPAPAPAAPSRGEGDEDVGVALLAHLYTSHPTLIETLNQTDFTTNRILRPNRSISFAIPAYRETCVVAPNAERVRPLLRLYDTVKTMQSAREHTRSVLRHESCHGTTRSGTVAMDPPGQGASGSPFGSARTA
jgi:hypothetical protein